MSSNRKRFLLIMTKPVMVNYVVILQGSDSFQMTTAVSVYSGEARSGTQVARPINQSLFVYESVELSLTPVLSDDDLDSDVAYPIMISKGLLNRDFFKLSLRQIFGRRTHTQ